MTDLILIPYGPGYLQLTGEEYAAILARGLAPGPNAAPAVAPVGAAQLLDSRQLSALLGVGDTLLEQMARDGRLPAVRIGKFLRFDPSEVLRILKAGHADMRSAAHGKVHDSIAPKTANHQKPTSRKPGLSGRDHSQEAR